MEATKETKELLQDFSTLVESLYEMREFLEIAINNNYGGSEERFFRDLSTSMEYSSLEKSIGEILSYSFFEEK